MTLSFVLETYSSFSNCNSSCYFQEMSKGKTSKSMSEKSAFPDSTWAYTFRRKCLQGEALFYQSRSIPDWAGAGRQTESSHWASLCNEPSEHRKSPFRTTEWEQTTLRLHKYPEVLKYQLHWRSRCPSASAHCNSGSVGEPLCLFSHAHHSGWAPSLIYQTPCACYNG